MDQQQLCEWDAVEACLECITSSGRAVSAFDASKWLRTISLMMHPLPGFVVMDAG